MGEKVGEVIDTVLDSRRQTPLRVGQVRSRAKE
jgi:hypothetical protein